MRDQSTENPKGVPKKSADDISLSDLVSNHDLVRRIPDARLDGFIGTAQMAFRRESRRSLTLETRRDNLLNRRPVEYQTYLTDLAMLDSRLFPREVAIAELVEALTPQYASFTKKNEAYIFKLNSGGTVKVDIDNKPNITGINFYFGNPDPRLAATQFLDALAESGNLGLIFRKNTYHQQEKVVQRHIDVPRKGFPTPKLPAASASVSFKEGVIIVPDEHGDMERYNLVKNLIKGGKLDWFAIEMLPHTMQNTVNAFINEPENSPKYKKARQALIRYYSKHWDNQFEDIGLPSSNPYFKLLELCRKHKVQVRAMDVTSEYYGQNPQKAKLIVGTRNLVWSDQIPDKGKGVIFGGWAHFNWNPGIKVQDFLSERREDIHIVEFADA